MFEPIRQITVGYPEFKVTSFVDFRPYFKLFKSPEDYTNQFKEQLTYVVTKSSHMFMEINLSKVIDQVLPIGLEAVSYFKVNHQFQQMFFKLTKKFYILQRHFRVYALNS